MKKLYKGGENIETINHLLDGETVIVGGKGNSINYQPLKWLVHLLLVCSVNHN